MQLKLEQHYLDSLVMHLVKVGYNFEWAESLEHHTLARGYRIAGKAGFKMFYSKFQT